MLNTSDLIGQKFNNLTIQRLLESNQHGSRVWRCKCDCGNTTKVTTAQLKNGHTKSCGCLAILATKERQTKHGHTADFEVSNVYKVWAAMKGRCLNPNDKRFKNYGGKGIIPCTEWLDFSTFLDDMGYPPRNSMLARLDTSKGYTKENCIWAPRGSNINNRSCTLWCKMPDGRKLPAAEAYKEFGGSKYTFLRKIKTPEGFQGCTLVSK